MAVLGRSLASQDRCLLCCLPRLKHLPCLRHDLDGVSVQTRRVRAVRAGQGVLAMSGPIHCPCPRHRHDGVRSFNLSRVRGHKVILESADARQPSSVFSYNWYSFPGAYAFANRNYCISHPNPHRSSAGCYHGRGWLWPVLSCSSWHHSFSCQGFDPGPCPNCCALPLSDTTDRPRPDHAEHQA